MAPARGASDRQTETMPLLVDHVPGWVPVSPSPFIISPHSFPMPAQPSGCGRTGYMAISRATVSRTVIHFIQGNR
jgi:hypothetical protein